MRHASVDDVGFVHPAFQRRNACFYFRQHSRRNHAALHQLIDVIEGQMRNARVGVFRIGADAIGIGDDDEFLCFTDPSTPVVKKLFKKIDATPQLTRLTEALQQILASDPEIREVVWTESR